MDKLIDTAPAGCTDQDSTTYVGGVFNVAFKSAIMAIACAHTVASANEPSGTDSTILGGAASITVTAEREYANGPVEGYRATRSATLTKTDLPLREVPASVTVVPKDLIRDIGAQSIADLLRYVPGVTAHQGEGNRDQLVLRGNNTSADFFVDGLRDDAQVFRDPYNLERVEILKGATGMTFGRGSGGGAVNRVTKHPSFTPIREIALSVGSFNNRRLSVDIGDALNTAAAWRVNAVAEDDGSFRNGVTSKREAINPAFALRLDANSQLLISVEHLRDSRTADRGVPSQNGLPFDTPAGAYFGNAEQSHATSTVDAFNATFTQRLSPAWKWKSALRIAHYDKFYQNVYPGSAVVRGAPNTNSTLTLAAYNNANQRTNTFWQNDFTAALHFGGIVHHILLGGEIGRQDSHSQRNSGYFGLGTTAASQTALVSASAPFAVATRFAAQASDTNAQAKADIAAVYAQDLIDLPADVKLLIGVRFDRFAVRVDDQRTLVIQPPLARTDYGLSPRAGVIWNLSPRTTVYASASEAFLPSAETLSLATTTADLGPERARNIEIGVKRDLTENATDLALTAAIFRQDKRDVRVADPQRPGFFVKTGLQRTSGLELGLAGSVTSNWQLFAGVAALDARVESALATGTSAAATAIIPAGRRVGLVPRWAASVWNKFRFDANWSAGFGVATQSNSYTSFTNTVVLPKFARADAALFYTFTDSKTRLALNIENLANRRYYPTADGDNNISVGSPRAAKLSLVTAF
jgi:catecholate siderophore receptor